MSEIDRKKFVKLIYYGLCLVFLLIDLILKINYSFFIVCQILGKILLIDGERLSDISPLEYLVILVILPVIIGTFLN